MSSESRRRRTRSRGPATSSPLKPKAPPPAEPASEDDDPVPDEAREAPKSEPDEVQQGNEEELAELQEKQSRLETLRKQLAQLRHDHRQLKAAIDGDDDLSEEVSSMLRQSIGDGSTAQLKHLGDADGMSAHLTLFAPGNLQLTSRTETKIIKDRTKVVHTLQVEAPQPWPPDVLSFAVDVLVDAERVQVEQVELKAGTNKVRRPNTTKVGIYRWASERLDHPLHGLDVSGVIWGMGQWFNAAVERGKVFLWMDLKYNRPTMENEEQKDDERGSELKHDKCIELARYLDMTFISADMTATPNGGKSRKKIMLSWAIDLDWAGGVMSDIQISTSGIPQKAEPGLKTIFSDLVPKLGVKGAFQKVWSLIHNESEEFTLRKAAGKKRR